MTDRDRAKQRNKAAYEFASQHPDKVADAALESEELRAVLDDAKAAPPTFFHDFHEGTLAAFAKLQKVRDDQTQKCRVGTLLLRWEITTSLPRESLERWIPEYAATDLDDLAQSLIHHLAKIPESLVSDSGISLLTKLVEDMPVTADWDNRRHSNLSLPLTNTRYFAYIRTQDNGQGQLFEDNPIRNVPLPPAPEPRFEVGHLPGLEPPPSKLVPCALLTLWNPAPASGRHGPVPRLCRVGWAPLLAVPPEARINENVSLQIELGKLAALVNPRTVTVKEGRVSGYKRTVHGPQIVQALRELNDPESGGAVAWRSGERSARRLIVLVQDFPDTHDVDAVVSFVVSLPPGSKQGAQVDAVLLRLLASVSARQWRAMVTAYCLWDRYGTVKGRLVDPTVPAKVRTDAAGYSIDARGRVLTDRRGRPTRSTTHPKAVQIGTDRMQRSELDRYYPWLVGDDLILTCHPTVASTMAKRREQRRSTIQTLVAMRDAERLDFHTKYRTVRGGRELVGVRLLPTAEHRQTHAARWAANRHGR